MSNAHIFMADGPIAENVVEVTGNLHRWKSVLRNTGVIARVRVGPCTNWERA